MTGYLYQGNPWLEHANAQIMAERNGTSRGATPRLAGRIRHGTPAGYRAHLRYDEAACPACLDAERQRGRAKPGASGLSTSEAARARWQRIRGGSDS